MVPVVYNGIAVGPASTSSILKIAHDIAAYGKLLTGRYLPLAVTVTTKETFTAFLSDYKQKVLLLGHSYTASPIC